jgi:hypothetical protein
LLPFADCLLLPFADCLLLPFADCLLLPFNTFYIIFLSVSFFVRFCSHLSLVCLCVSLFYTFNIFFFIYFL